MLPREMAERGRDMRPLGEGAAIQPVADNFGLAQRETGAAVN
jgi:hypothetical protein